MEISNKLFTSKEKERFPSEKELYIAEHKFIIIRSVIEKYKLKNMISHLCQIAEVSRSGYYNYFSSKSQDHRFLRDEGNART